MVGKSAVSTLQEYCAKNKIPAPTYETIPAEDNGFTCKIDVLNLSCYGNGRSKRDAKHQAAAVAIQEIRKLCPEKEVIPMVPADEIPSTDVIVVLRDYCVQHDHPLPVLDIIEQVGTPDAPQFTALCCVASIKRYAISDNKKDARQKAALEMLQAIMNNEVKVDEDKQVATLLETKIQEAEHERYHKFKTYRELAEAGGVGEVGVRACDRHNYFTKFYDDLKAEAKKIMNVQYDSPHEQALDILKALKISPKITKIAAESEEPLTYIELNCVYDVVFCNTASAIYPEIVNYFKHMID